MYTSMAHRDVMIANRLEAVVSTPSPGTGWIAVISHPHPKLGGDLDNNVVQAVARGLLAMGVATVVFNTRGVGRSLGSSTWRGVEERLDILDVLAFAWAQPGVSDVLLCAYSFGAAVGCSALQDAPKKPSAVAVIGYPKGFWASFLFSAHYSRFVLGSIPKLLVQGSNDNFTSPSTLEALFQEQPEPKKLVILPEVDHFFQGSEGELVEAIVSWLKPML